MAEVQIVSSAKTTGAIGYTVPESGEFTLKAVYCEFRDAGAAFDWTPVVEIVSDSGHTIALAIDHSVLITAGDDADASFFPGVRGGVSAAILGASPMLYMVQSTPAQSIPNNTPTLVEFGTTVGTRFYTNSAATFQVDTAASGDYATVHILAQGAYLCYARLTFDTPGNYNKQLDLHAASTMTNPIGNASELDRSFDTFADTVQATSLLVLDSSAAAAANNDVYVAATQVSGAARNVLQATLWIQQLDPVFP